jgi:hypothetical protein
MAKRIVRVAWLVCVLGGGSIGLAASCSSSTPSPATPSDAAAMDHTVEGAAALQCPLPTPNPAKCSGSDPTFVFVPPLMCDPSLQEAGAASSDAAADSGGDGGDPCDGLTNIFSVFFSTKACDAFVAAESSGAIGSETDPGSPIMAQPSDGAMLTSDAWSLFVWARHATDARRGPLDLARDFIEPSAYATPLNGDAYVLEFSQGCQEVMRIMVTTGFWAPDPVSWSTLSSLTGPVRVQVFWMSFTNDGLAATPLPSVPITITMQNTAGD